ncbi:Histidinol dehydrogenase [Candidatus Hodgkinia cicadicola]|uniref:Histidinol dehydrogenase n=1 Tax=Candidatus Hodgkinia cicadicola TaxID=573658 RepID=A0ABX4MK01_9HYPH|nr:Histidinol dehydrogenase [Candidatus Hodgkinia cicadicola]
MQKYLKYINNILIKEYFIIKDKFNHLILTLFSACRLTILKIKNCFKNIKESGFNLKLIKLNKKGNYLKENHLNKLKSLQIVKPLNDLNSIKLSVSLVLRTDSPKFKMFLNAIKADIIYNINNVISTQSINCSKRLNINNYILKLNTNIYSFIKSEYFKLIASCIENSKSKLNNKISDWIPYESITVWLTDPNIINYKTILLSLIPAKLAGVSNISIVSIPCQKISQPQFLVATALCGVCFIDFCYPITFKMNKGLRQISYQSPQVITNLTNLDAVISNQLEQFNNFNAPASFLIVDSFSKASILKSKFSKILIPITNKNHLFLRDNPNIITIVCKSLAEAIMIENELQVLNLTNVPPISIKVVSLMTNKNHANIYISEKTSADDQLSDNITIQDFCYR